MYQQSPTSSDLQPIEKKPWAAPQLSHLDVDQTQFNQLNTTGDGDGWTSGN